MRKIHVAAIPVAAAAGVVVLAGMQERLLPESTLSIAYEIVEITLHAAP